MKKIFLISIFVFLFFLIILDFKFHIFQKPLSAKKFLGIPFVAQVGQGNETLDRLGCEEAAIVMIVKKISNNQINSSKEEMEELVQYQEKEFVGHNQIGPQTIAKILENQYSIKSKVVKVKEQTELKEYLENNYVVVVPSIAKELNNPLYREKGYHMIVLNGFNESGFFAHDPGTNSGSNYYYPNQNIFNAINNIETGEKEVLIIKEER